MEHVFNELDHTGGLDGFFKNYFKLKIYPIRVKSIQSVFQIDETT